MRKLKRSECAVLHLVLKYKWYDMIASGWKREEYRDWETWNNRITKWIRRFLTYGVYHMVVGFQRGYTKPSMWFECSVSSEEAIGRGKHHPEWGEPDTPHYVIALGERVELEDADAALEGAGE